MNFSGFWINKQSDELIKLTGPHGGDNYTLEYDHNGNEFQTIETIPIYISNDKHALLAHSKKFGRCDIFILSPECFRIGDEIFEKHNQKKE